MWSLPLSGQGARSDRPSAGPRPRCGPALPAPGPITPFLALCPSGGQGGAGLSWEEMVWAWWPPPSLPGEGRLHVHLPPHDEQVTLPPPGLSANTQMHTAGKRTEKPLKPQPLSEVHCPGIPGAEAPVLGTEF